jgi:hypothetical protein
MRVALAIAVITLASCANVPRTSPDQYDAALTQSIAEANELAKAGKLPTMRGYVSEIYLRVQRRVPDMSAPSHAYYQRLIEGAPEVDAGRMTVQELTTSAELRQAEVSRERKARTDAQAAAAWAEAFANISKTYSQRATTPNVRCVTNTIGSYTYTNCQ